MRIDCTLPGHESCYVTVSDAWTRGEIRRFWSGSLGTGDESDADNLLIQKTEAVYLETAEGLALDSADDLTDENLDALPYQLYVWLSNAYGHAIGELQRIAKKNVSCSFDSTAAKK